MDTRGQFGGSARDERCDDLRGPARAGPSALAGLSARAGLSTGLTAGALLATMFLPVPALATGSGPDLTDAAISRALGAVAPDDLILVQATPKNPSVTVAMRVHVPPRVVRALLLNPATWREAIPALVRAEITGAHRQRASGGKAPTVTTNRLVSWELEIPGFNLKGRLWLRPVGALGVELIFADGDLAPGRLRLDARPGPASSSAPSCDFTVKGWANLRSSNWLFRRMMKASPHAEAAMMTTALWTLARGTAMRAAHPSRPERRRPGKDAPPRTPRAAALAAAPLTTPALAPFRAAGVLATVETAPSGRLVGVRVAVPIRRGAGPLARELADPQRSWARFPGWQRVQTQPDGHVDVDGDLAFVDLDARWSLAVAPPETLAPGMPVATAVAGQQRGAVMAWDVRADQAGALAVLAMNPRLPQTGYVPHKFVEREPLLEHGLALALAYVNAMTTIGAPPR